MREATRKYKNIAEQHEIIDGVFSVVKIYINGKTGTQILEWVNYKYRDWIYGYK